MNLGTNFKTCELSGDTLNPQQWVSSLIQLFIEQIVTECLPWAGSWGESEMNRKTHLCRYGASRFIREET